VALGKGVAAVGAHRPRLEADPQELAG
jgi:hypothetical protein